MSRPFGHHQPVLGKLATDGIDVLGALAHQQVAGAEHGRAGLGIRTLHGHKAHGRPLRRLADGLRVRGIVLVPLHIEFDVSWLDQPNVMSQRCDLPRSMVRAGASLHADQAGRQGAEEVENRRSAQLLAQDNSTLHVHSVKLKDELGQIDPECSDLQMDGPFLRWVATAPAWQTAMPSGWGYPHHQTNANQSQSG